jgi:hypothetical protein
MYVLFCCAWMDWATHETPGAPVQVGDIFAHFEWTNPLNPYGSTRKTDPWGRCRWNNYENRKWDMNKFRAEVYKTYMAGPNGTVTPPIEQPVDPNAPQIIVPQPTLQFGSAGPEAYKMINTLKQWKWYPAEWMDDTNNGEIGERGHQGIITMQQSLSLDPDGLYGPVSYLALTKFLMAMWELANPKPVEPEPTPEPPPPPPPDKTTAITSAALYYVRPNTGPWQASADTGVAQSVITAANPGTWHPGQRILIPTKVGVATKVQSGEGASMVMRRIYQEMETKPGVTEDAFARWNTSILQRWNGGESRVLQPGDPVFWPAN